MDDIFEIFVDDKQRGDYCPFSNSEPYSLEESDDSFEEREADKSPHALTGIYLLPINWVDCRTQMIRFLDETGGNILEEEFIDWFQLQYKAALSDEQQVNIFDCCCYSLINIV